MESRQNHSCTDTVVPCTYSLHCLEGTPGESRDCSVIRMIAVEAVSVNPAYIVCGSNPQQQGEDVVLGYMHQPSVALLMSTIFSFFILLFFNLKVPGRIIA